MDSPRASALYWQARAEEARTRADRMRDPESKRTMLEIAESFERMARLAEERTRQNKS